MTSEFVAAVVDAQGRPKMDGPSQYAPEVLPYRQLRDAILGVTEREDGYRPGLPGEPGAVPNEHLLHLLWQQQRSLRQPLTTLDRQRVTVYRPGRWIRGMGPDFLDAKLRFDDGPIRVGAIEVHVRASDWMRHGHDRDASYTSVLLHVIWHNDIQLHTVADAHGRTIPQLELPMFLNTPLHELQEAFDDELWLAGASAGLTPCQRVLQELSSETIGRLLDLAGEERWRQKASRVGLKMERRGAEQALYESILEALGFKGNRMPFWQLARLAPVQQLRQAVTTQAPTPMHYQAILFGVAGFLAHWQANLATSMPPESRAYVETLLALWEPVSALFPERLDERQWRIAGIRPSNFPQRRIAAAGHLLVGLTQHSVIDLFLAPLHTLPVDASRVALRRCQQQLAHTLRVSGQDDFWQHRYTVDGLWHDHAIDLLGSGRAATMVIDVLLPAAAALARLGYEPIALAAVRALFLAHRRLPSNEITREMMRQFFGADRTRGAVVNSACRQQALIQLYRDFCLNEQETCQDCALPRLVARLEQRPTDAPPVDP